MKKFILIILMFGLILPSQASFWNKKDKDLEAELEGKGYAGTLPDLDNVFKKKENKKQAPLFESQKDFREPKELKPIPKDNPSFVDIIQKKDKTSEYIKDINEIIPIMEKLLDSIEMEQSLQLFVTRANVLNMNIDYLIQKYDRQPESYYESFKKMADINRAIKAIVVLRQEAVTYQRYLAYQESGSIYNPENINQQLEYLKEELISTIVLLKEEE